MTDIEPGTDNHSEPDQAVTVVEGVGYADDVPAVERLVQVIAGLHGGEPRDGQTKMVSVFEEAIRTERPAAVQAGTGVGKTFGSLIPAICSGQKTVMVTSSKALQDQLATKDLPFLEQHLPVSFRWAILKGRSNYLCLAHADEAAVEIKRRRAAGDQSALFDQEAFTDKDVDDDFDDPDLVDEVRRLLEWADTTNTGDRAELEFEPSPKAWGKVSVGPSECPGKQTCSHGDMCLAEFAKARAEQADVVVVNAHLYGAHVALGGGLLPDHTLLVVDEAHDFEDAMVGALSSELSGMRIRQIRRAAKRVIDGSSDMLGALQDVAGRLDDALGVVYDTMMESSRSTRLPEGPIGNRELAVTLTAASDVIQNVLDTLRVVTKRSQNPSFQNRAERAVRMTSSLLDDIRKALTADETNVCWVEEFAGRHVLKVGTVRVGGLLKTVVWDEGVLGLFCSATLPPTITERLGEPNAVYVDVGSPFDYRRNSRLYVPKDVMPNPRDQRWADAVASETKRLITAIGGRTLALFTSNAMMRRTAEHVRETLPDMTILCQGDAPKPALIREFTDNHHACLFATASFWQGVDVPGSTLSLVIVDKIPFPVPVDPIYEARCEAVKQDLIDKGRTEKDADWASFERVAIPAAATQLAQGVGRLIRTSSDKGMVAVFDTRLATAGYRHLILSVLPPMARIIDPDQAVEFLQQLHDEVTA